MSKDDQKAVYQVRAFYAGNNNPYWAQVELTLSYRDWSELENSSVFRKAMGLDYPQTNTKQKASGDQDQKPIRGITINLDEATHDTNREVNI